jgi:ribokinase
MYDIITFGSATRDLFLKSKEFKAIKNKTFITGNGLCFNLGSKIYLDDLFFATGGGGTNTAATFAKHGFKVAYVGRVGNDTGGRTIIEELKNLGIDSFIGIDKKLKTAYSIVLSTGKERTILVYKGACHNLEKKDIPFDRLKAKWFYIAGLSGKSASEILPIIDFARKNRIKIALNPSGSQLALGLNGLKNILSAVDVLLLNQEEGARLAGLPFNKEKEIFKKLSAQGRPASGGDKIVIMTKGPKGVVVSDGKNIYSAGVFKEKRYIDRTGAGDAFGSGFVSGLIRNGIEEGIKLGTANGTAVVEELGAKNGLLTKNRYQNEARWKNLKISKEKL